jgi:hypothetical protein
MSTPSITPSNGPITEQAVYDKYFATEIVIRATTQTGAVGRVVAHVKLRPMESATGKLGATEKALVIPDVMAAIAATHEVGGQQVPVSPELGQAFGALVAAIDAEAKRRGLI